MKQNFAIILLLIAIVSVRIFSATPVKSTAQSIGKYRVVIDSGKVWKCDSSKWYKYDTLVPVVKTVVDTVHKVKKDTIK
jgi:hypothetical protein